MSNSDAGYISLHRRVFNNKFYRTEPFCKMMAWIDLLLLANHKPSGFYIRGIFVEVERGQVGYSEEQLSKRWKWSRGKVRRYLVELENEGQISTNHKKKYICSDDSKMVQQTVQQNNNITTLISILNYERYQNTGTANGTADGQQTVQQTDINNNDNNDNKVEARQKFYDSVAKYKGEYPKEMLRAFFDYWSELNKSGKKMRWELQTTFEVVKRLATWARRDKEFNSHPKDEKSHLSGPPLKTLN